MDLRVYALRNGQEPVPTKKESPLSVELYEELKDAILKLGSASNKRHHGGLMSHAYR